MSFSSDVHGIFSKPHGLHLFSENHPVLITLGALMAVVTALILATGLLMR